MLTNAGYSLLTFSKAFFGSIDHISNTAGFWQKSGVLRTLLCFSQHYLPCVEALASADGRWCHKQNRWVPCRHNAAWTETGMRKLAFMLPSCMVIRYMLLMDTMDSNCAMCICTSCLWNHQVIRKSMLLSIQCGNIMPCMSYVTYMPPLKLWCFFKAIAHSTHDIQCIYVDWNSQLLICTLMYGFYSVNTKKKKRKKKKRQQCVPAMKHSERQEQ